MQPDSGFASQMAKSRHATVLLLPILVFALVAVARIIYVSLYAAPLPFWDQWDELDRQIRPWFSGTWHALQLFAPHNQHRIAFTRAISLLLAGANGHVFDNLVEAYASAFIYAVLWAVLYALLVHHDTSRARSSLIALAVVVLGVLPFDWENTLIGFQNQFYIMALLAVVLVGIAAYRDLSIGTILLLTVLAVASLFTMGSGLLAAPAVCFALLLWACRKPVPRPRLFVALGSMVLTTVAGLVLLKDGSPVESLRATGALDFLRGLLVAMMWPSQQPSFAPWWMFAALLWAPSAAWLWRFFRTRRAEANEVFAVSLAGWVFLQYVAIAYSRGHDISSLSSRYSEIAALGIAANAWLALKLAARRPDARWPQVAIGVAAVLVGWVFWYRTPGDLASMKERYAYAIIETRNVQHYLAGFPLPAVPESSLALPYPKVQRLRSLLDSKEIRALLPPAAFLPGDNPHRQASLSGIAAKMQTSIRRWFPKSVWNAGNNKLEMLTPSPFRSYKKIVPSHASNAQCSLDAINGQPAVTAKPIPRSAGVTFGGWMGNGRGQAVAKGIFVLEGTQKSYAAPFVTGVLRPDVAKALQSEAMARSGYNLTTTLGSVEAGTYSLFVADPIDPSVLCDLHRAVTVH